MNITALFKLRPKAGTAEAIRGAMAEADTMLAAATRQLGELNASRAGVLLGGSDHDIQRSEVAVREAKDTIDRATVMKAELERRLAAAEREDHLAVLRAKIATANEITAAAKAAICTRYVEIEAAIQRDVLELEDRSVEARREAGEALLFAHKAGLVIPDDRAFQVDGSPLRAALEARGVRSENIYGERLRDFVRLPSLNRWRD